MNKGMKIFTSVLLAILLALVGFAGGFIVNVFVLNKQESDVYVSGDLSIHFLELGNEYTGDSIFIQCGEYDILIDAGSRQSSATTIINYVDQYVTDNTLEFVIATHADQDHIAAFPSTKSRKGIFEYYQVETIIDFPKTNKNTDVYNNYIKYRDNEVENGATRYSALDCYNNTNGAKRVYELVAGVEMEILYNYYYENHSSDENNYSVCMMINQGDNHYLFTGDLEEDGEKELVDYYETNHGGLPHCVLYKAGHHGSKTSSTQKLLTAITPDYVCVCCCAGSDEYTDNPDNQFPTKQMIQNVSAHTDNIFVTSMINAQGEAVSMNGNIVFSVKNGEISIECSNNNTILKETDWFKSRYPSGV